MLVIMTLSGCASTKQEKPRFDTSTLDNSLIGAVTSIEQSIRVLAETRNALAIQKMSPAQREALQTQVRAMPNGLEKNLPFEAYYGELEPFIYKIAGMTNYEVIVDGRQSSVMVKTPASSRNAYDILRDLGAQAGEKAVVYVIEHESDHNSRFNGLIRIKYKGV